MPHAADALRSTDLTNCRSTTRTVARALRLNEDLVEAISLAHDLGHGPFGHAGEEAIREVFDPDYRHNDQSLRIVDYLARDGQGLNLTYEVRMALPDSTPVAAGMRGEGAGQDTLEGKVQKISDSIAYINHDVDDALNTFVSTLDTSLQALHLRMPMRFS